MKIPPTRIPVDDATRQLIRRLIVEEALHTSPPPVEIMDALIDAGSLLRLAPFTPLIAEGETDDSFYILVDGITRNWHWNADVEQTTSFACRGTQLLDYHCYYAGKPSLDTIEACCECTVLQVPRARFDALMDRCPEFTRWQLMMSYDAHYFLELKRATLMGDAAARYKALVENRIEILQKVPLKIIASYLGITPQHLSLIRRRKN